MYNFDSHGDRQFWVTSLVLRHEDGIIFHTRDLMMRNSTNILPQNRKLVLVDILLMMYLLILW
jgi:hypothetical protein